MTRGRWARATRVARILARAGIALGLAVLCIFNADFASASPGYVIGPAADATFSSTPVAGSTFPSVHVTSTPQIKRVAHVCADGSASSWDGDPTVVVSSTSFSGGASVTASVGSIACPSGHPYLADFIYEYMDGDPGPYSQGATYTSGAYSIVTEYDFVDKTNDQDEPPGLGDGGGSGCVVDATASLTLNPADDTVDLLTVRISADSSSLPPAGWRVDSPVPPIAGGVISYPLVPVGYMGQGDFVAGNHGLYLKQFTLTLPDQYPTSQTLDDGSTELNIYLTALASRTPDVPLCASEVPTSTTGPVDGSGGGTGAGDGTSCSYGWNLLHDFECGLRWAFYPGTSVSDEVDGLKDDFSDTGPGSVIVSGVGFLHTLVTVMSGYGWDVDCGNVGVDCLTEPDDGNGHQLEFIEAIPDLPGYDYVRTAADVAIYGSAMIACWYIARRHLGSQT